MAVLLAELKALVDSFPHHQRTAVIKTIETVLGTGCRLSKSAFTQFAARNKHCFPITFPGNSELDSDSQGHSEDQKREEEYER